MFDVLVIGGGPAGVTAALRSRELGASVALVERSRLGGTCTNDGCAPTRVLAHAARLVREADQFDDYGLIGQPAVVDLPKLLSRTQQIIYKLHEKKQLLYHLKEAGVTVYTQAGNARFSDPHTVEIANGTRLEAEKFILAVGGKARRLPFPGAEYALTHSDVWGLKKLPASMVILGGAATGCQVASIFSAFGTQVTILERSPRLLAMEDEYVSQAITDAFHRRGIQIITGIGDVQGITREDDRLDFSFQMGEDFHSISTEAVLMAVGWPGNADTLNLEAAGVEHERGYIKVDDYLRTSAPHIFAAGDITGRMMLVQSASYDARVAAENAVLGVGLNYRHSIVPHGGFTDPEYGSVGITEAAARQSGLDVVVATVPFADMDRAVIDGHTEGFCKLIVSQENHRILGAHIVGEQALEAVQLVAAGMAADMWVEQLAELEIAYPTYTAIVGLAARKVMRDLGVMPLAPEWRTLGRPHAEWEQSTLAD